MLSASPDLQDVAVFVQVVSSGSFSAAAVALGLPKSTISRRVSRLEDSLGVRLLQRTTRRMRLTDAGAAYHEQVSRALSSLDEAAAAVHEEQAEPRGTLRITAPVDFGQAYLAEICTTFLSRYPHVRIEADLSNRLVDMVREGFDLAIRAGQLTDSSLVARKFAPSQVWLVAAPSYLASRGVPQTPDDLVDHTAVLFRGSGGLQRVSLYRGQESVEVELRGSISGDDFSFNHAALRIGAGIGMLPAVLAASDVVAGRLQRILPAWHFSAGNFWVVYPSSRHLAAKVRAFRDFVIEWASPPPWERHVACATAQSEATEQGEAAAP